ncbi:MAG: hypothetical protein JWM85_1482 [Acidimicrobiaceae bacterium]|nr:hypothetical protein [Acidimicrobiaceae bacterium]
MPRAHLGRSWREAAILLRPRGAPASPAWWSVAAVGVYCLLALVAFLPYGPFDNTHLLSTSPHDSVDVGWFMAYGAYALEHAHNPFFTKLLEYPDGVNIPANQSMPLLGWVMTPITRFFGPFAMISFTMRLSFAASATAAYFAIRRVCVRRLAAFCGGLLFGFSPFLVAHNLENQNFSFLPVLPIAFLVAHRLLAGESVRTRRDGLFLGLLFAIQLYLNPEVLAELLLVLLIVVLGVLAVRAIRHRTVRSEAVSLLIGAGWALLALAVLGAPFAAYYLFGPQHATGPVVPPQYLAVFHTDLAELVFPDRNQLIGPTSFCLPNAACSAPAVWNGFGGALNEAGSYVGLPLLIGLVVFAVRYRRSRLVVFSSATFLVALAFSLGPDLVIYGHDTHIPMPSRIAAHIPLVSSAETIRYFLVADLAAAFLLAIGLDQLLTASSGLFARLRDTPWRTATVGLLAAVLLFPLIPRWPYPSGPTGIPAYFTTSAVDAIAPKAVVLTYPMPQSGAVQAMEWQMVSNFRFRLVWGYAYIADNGGVPEGNTPFKQPALPLLLNVTSGNDTTDPIPSLSITEIKLFRDGLRQFGVDDIIFDPSVGVGADIPVALRYLEASLGEKPVSVGGILAFYGVRKSLAESVHTVLIQDRQSGILSSYPPAR